MDYSRLPKVTAWGVEINEKMMQLSARVLQPPQVQYGGNKSQRPNYGSWNLRDTKVGTQTRCSIANDDHQFHKAGKPLRAWSVLNFDDRAPLDMIRE